MTGRSSHRGKTGGARLYAVGSVSSADPAGEPAFHSQGTVKDSKDMRLYAAKQSDAATSRSRCPWLPLLVTFILIALLFAPYCRADTHPLFEIAKSHGVIAPPNEVFLVEQGGETFLVGIGQSALKGDSPRGTTVARTVARVLAQKALTNFIHQVTLNVKETLTEERRRLVLERPGQAPQVVERSNSKYEEFISERGEGLLKAFDDVGEWIGADRKDFYYCLAIKL